MAIKISHNKYFKLKESRQCYGNILPKFALGKRTKNIIEAASCFSRCRETLNAYFRNRVNKGVVDTRILRLLIWFAVPGTVTIQKNNKFIQIGENNKENYSEYVTTEYDKSIYRASYVLNVIEKELGWKKTTIKKVNHRLGDRHNLYIVTASPKWVFSPPLLSLYTLILRTGTFKNISKIKSIDRLATAYTKTTTKHAIGQDVDIASLRKIAPILKKFLTNINEIYKDRNQKTNFSGSIIEGTTYDEGIMKLVRGVTGDKLVLKRFLKYTHK